MKELGIGVSTSARQRGESFAGFTTRAFRAGFGSMLVEEEQTVLEGDLVPLAASLREARARLVGVRAVPEREGLPLCLAAPIEQERAQAVQAALALGRLASSAGCRVVILEAGAPADRVFSPLAFGRFPDAAENAAESAVKPPRTRSSDAALDRLCRSLYELSGAQPDTLWCLRPSEFDDHLPLPEDYEPICSELGRRAPGFWHDTAAAALRAHRGGYSARLWLDGVPEALTGMTLSDTDGERVGLPPGCGLVNIDGIADSGQAGMPIVLGLAPDVAAAGFRMARATAEKLLRWTI